MRPLCTSGHNAGCSKYGSMPGKGVGIVLPLTRCTVTPIWMRAAGRTECACGQQCATLSHVSRVGTMYRGESEGKSEHSMALPGWGFGVSCPSVSAHAWAAVNHLTQIKRIKARALMTASHSSGQH